MTDAMTCRDAVDRLWAYIDGELEPVESERVRAHLALCARCFPHYDFQRAFRELLQRCAKAAAPPELRRRVFLRLLATQEGTDGGEVDP
jgi:anti-sigma factor (TIGR02949 family)